jgi:glycosyltransferase involved in cell wall biosynthesis
MTVAFLWLNYTDYMIDRVRAAQQALPDHAVVGIEIASSTTDYDWGRPDTGDVRIVTLFQQPYQSIPLWRRIIGVLRGVLRERPSVLFCCHYEDPAVFILAALARLCGCKTVMMNESKWDDGPRLVLCELLKIPFFLPYRFGLVGGRRTAQYLGHFGINSERVFFGYDTVSMARLRDLAREFEADPAFEARPIVVVSRFIEKKNLFRLLDGYARYRSLCDGPPRPLELLGSGPLEDALRCKIADEAILGVTLHGFASQRDVARQLSQALCLVLFSTVEQWGLVVNEAIALRVPVVVSTTIGACDLLVRTGINGFVVEPDNVEGLARILADLGADQALWQRLRDGAADFAPLADVRNFGEAAARIVAAP